MSDVKKIGGRVQIVPTKAKFGNVVAGTLKDEVATVGQLQDGTMNLTVENLIVEGTLTASALTTDSVAPAITAKAGGGQDATLALSKNLNIVTTVATAADSVTLPAAAAGLRITIVNLGANALAVFPYTSDTINDEAADASVSQNPETTVTYNCYTGVKWESDNESLDSFDYLYVTGLIRQGTTGVITAFAGGGQASATALTKGINNVSTVVTAGDSVKLMPAEQGLLVVVKNSGATALDIFPAADDSIDALAVNLAVRIAPSSTAVFFAKSTTVWESNVDSSFTLVAPTTNSGQLQILAANSAGNTITTITNASQAAARTYTILDAGASANFVMSEGTATINGVKTFGNQIIIDEVTNQIKFETGAFDTTLTVPIPAADRIVTLPDFGGNDSLVALAATQTLTNKTLTSPTISIFDTSLTIQDNGDTSKQLKFELSGITAATTRTLTAPDANTTIVGTDATQTLTNKTINLTSNTLVATSAQLATAVTDETGSGLLVFATSPTLTTPNIGVATGTSLNLTANTNQLVLDSDGAFTTTITAPVPAASAVVTIPDLGAAWSVVGTGGAQTIGGVKTFSSAPVLSTATLTTNGDTITFQDLGNANVVVSEGTQTINGAKTFSSIIDADGGVTTDEGDGYRYTGTLVNTVGATPQTLNTFVGTALFNAIADTAAGTDVAATQVINNSLVTANTRANVAVFSQTVAANSCFVVKNVAMGAGTITVTLHNAGSATSGAGGACGLSFTLFQL